MLCSVFQNNFNQLFLLGGGWAVGVEVEEAPCGSHLEAEPEE